MTTAIPMKNAIQPKVNRFKFRAARYSLRGLREKALEGTHVLPHSVNVSMTTLADGRARWTYTETFRMRQFPSRKVAERARKDTIAMLQEHALAEKIKVTFRGHSITLSAVSTRDEFADRMACEFIAWNGRVGRASLSKIILGAMRMTLAGIDF